MTPALSHLIAAEPAFAPLIARIGRPTLRPERGRSPYEALLRAITHQQLHARAAEAILARFCALYPAPFPAPADVIATPDAPLRACGLSASKIAAIRDLCARTLDGTVPSRRAAARLSDAALIERLVSIRGIGRWTVEMLLIFTLGRPDVLPVDDFGIREGWRLLLGLDERPKPKILAAHGAVFAPYRSTAAWYLWRAADEGKKIKPAN
jgi:DNA-3-methyladenine glycosylase II